ncbi:hypothetical protein BRPE64_ACDS06840 [Caballeronia insecticola]|uniref:Uncharacterized protein n=1 Tax=Caballeronia insecticola TaxID=758793 RepID=R4WFJ1_9BURK|nr:hypothetical protein BRPE64_ACDS06840 [Caballeronia insecticola]
MAARGACRCRRRHVEFLSEAAKPKTHERDAAACGKRRILQENARRGERSCVESATACRSVSGARKRRLAHVAAGAAVHVDSHAPRTP